MVQIVEAVFGSEEEARQGYEDLIADKSFLEEYTEFEGNRVFVRASTKEKAEDVVKMMESVTSPSGIWTREEEEKSKGGVAQKLKEGFGGIQEGVRTAQKGARAAEKRVGGISRAPKGGYIQSTFGRRGKGRQVYGWASANYKSYSDAEKAERLLIERLGVPREAVDIKSFPDANIHKVTVAVTSGEKQEGVKNFLRKNTSPERVGD